ncbi:hypothetical protein BH11VER1_BH11VER1_41950 [soil metagenome]
MPDLKNMRHELFARRIAAGEKASPVYRELYPLCSKSANSQSSLLMSNPKVFERINEIRSNASLKGLEKTYVTIHEKRMGFADIWRLSLASLLNDDGSLDMEAVQKIPPWALQKLKIHETETTTGSGDNTTTTKRRRIEIELVDKLAAAKLDTLLAGPEQPAPEDEIEKEACYERARAFLKTWRGNGEQLLDAVEVRKEG